MYQLGVSRSKKRRRIFLSLLASLVLFLLAAILGARYALKSQTTLNQAAAVVKPAQLPHADKYQTVKGPTFSLEVPTTWKAVTPPASAYTLYRWQGTTINNVQRWTDVYVDTIPPDFAVNRMTPIKADGNKINVLNDTSDNCANFTDTSQAAPKPAVAPAKWWGIDFSCDLANTTRHVVGTATAETGKAILLSGGSGSHRYYFVYTDNSITPDYTIFSRQLESFRSL